MIRLQQTCSACPEQYDALDDDGNVVGYLRLRHGHFTVQASGPGYEGSGHGVLVYEAEPEGDGAFMPTERQAYLDVAVARIESHLAGGEVLFTFTREQADALAGRPVTDEEAARIAKAVPFSSVPDALAEVTGSIAGYPD